jgi:MFS-type transporter involved in bile tolerance (Atg22 family)
MEQHEQHQYDSNPTIYHDDGSHHNNNHNKNHRHDTWTESTWTSIFAAPCWVSPLYFSTTLDDDGTVVHGPPSVQQQDEYGHHTTTSRTMSTSSSLSNVSDGKRVSSIDRKQQEHDEVLGWTLDACARGVAVIGTAVFVSSDLLRLAKEATGCVEYEEMWQQECTQRVYGMRPSSILAYIVMVVGLLSAVLMPLIGSIIDHTKYRRAVGSISAAFMSVMILIQMLVMEDHWFVAAILQIFVAFSYTVHLCATYAYLPELTTDHEKLTQYAARFSAAQYSGSVLFLLAMVGILSLVSRNYDIRSSTISQTVVFVVCLTFFGYAWTWLFQPRPASQRVPKDRTLLSAGFWKIRKTAQTILLHHSAIKWFLVSAAFTQAATTTFSTIAITYMTELLGFDSKENGIAILILLLFGVPGTKIAAWLTSSINPIRSLQTNLIFWICSVSAASLFLYKPDQQGMAYAFAMFWGLAIGWVYPTEKTLYVTIIPRGQEAELMGTYICACQMLSWLPPLVFSVMNETGFSMRAGLFTLTFYFAVSFVILFFVGDYNEAVAHAKAIDEGHISFDVTPANDLAQAIGACYEEFADEAICHQPGMISDAASTTGNTVIVADASTIQQPKRQYRGGESP